MPECLLAHTVAAFRLNDHESLRFRDDALAFNTGPKASTRLQEEHGLPVYADQVVTPKNHSHAKTLPDWLLWRKAEIKEMKALDDNDTFEWVSLDDPCLKGRKIMRGMFVYKCKQDSNGHVLVRKARAVLAGSMQIPGVDFDQTFAPTARATSIKLLLSIAAIEGLNLEQYDISSAFVSAPMDKDVYLYPPDGFPKKPGHVLRVRRALYGACQSPRLYYQELRAHLKSLGFVASDIDPCLWRRVTKNTTTIMCTVVDDMLIATTLKPGVLIKALARRFNMKNLGPLNYCLGLRIKRDLDNHRIYVDQESYIEKIVRSFKMEDEVKRIKPSTPGQPSVKLSAQDCVDYGGKRAPFPYRELVGALLYLTTTRPDLQYSLSVLSRFCKGPCEQHWRALKHLLCFAYHTRSLPLCLGGLVVYLWGYTDADWGGENVKPGDQHRSTSGGMALVGDGVVASYSKLQKFTALSSTSSEFMAASTLAIGSDLLADENSKLAVGERAAKIYAYAKGCVNLLSLRTILEELGYPQDAVAPEGTPLIEDSRGAYCSQLNPINKNLRHVNRRHHRIRQEIENKHIKPVQIGTNNMLADLLTKNLPPKTFNYLAGWIFGKFTGAKPGLPDWLKKALGY